MSVNPGRALSIVGLTLLLTNISVFLAQESLYQAGSGAFEIPRLITLNGSLKDRNGKPLSGVVGLRFALYKDQEDGSPLWVENQNGQLDEQGRYTVLLGAGSGLPLELFTSGEARWLGVQAILPGEQEQPRFLMVSVPYALKAADSDTLGGKPASAYKLAETDSEGKPLAETGSAPPAGSDPVPPSSDGTPGYLAMYLSTTVTGNSNIFQQAGTNNIGVATANPIAPLQVRIGSDVNFAMDPGNVAGAARLDAFNDAASANIPIEIQGSTVSLYSGGTVGVGVNASGNVGIKTANPVAPLHVRVAPNVNLAVDPGNVAGAARLGGLNDAANANIPVEIQGSTVSLYGNGALGVGVTSTGNVGIGTMSPIGKLQTRISPNVNFAMNSGNAPGAARLDAFNDAANANIPIEIQGSSVSLFGAGGVFGLGVNSSGNVGVGTPSPTVKLDVSGAVKGTSFAGDGSQLTSVNAALLGGKNANSYLTRGITYLAGCDTCSPLTTGDDQKNIYYNVVGAMTVNEVTCFADGGTATINILRDTGTGSPTSVLSQNLTCNGSIGASSTILSPGHKLDFDLATTDGTPKRITVAIKATLN